ncbi:MAG: thiolase domain-containing protein [Candidatus Thermoplasmatota archaeon]|jgi:acetyl-CoA C-acetyltransferase|nr:thiolase domain-containing protein [Candidatus Thermoplasmatota archaeon]
MGKSEREVYMVSGGVTKFTKASPDMDFRLRVKKAFDYAMNDVGMDLKDIDGSVASYFSDHFQRQLMSGIMVQDYLGLTPKPSKRVEGGGATGGLAFQTGVNEIASGRMDTCAVYGFETMSHVNTWKGNEFIALASDTNFDYPVGGFYTGYYAMMAVRYMHEFGATPEQLAMVSVKNHKNAMHNPYAQSPMNLTVEDVRKSPMVSYPLTRLDVCTMSDGAAVAILASKEKAFELCDNPVLIKGIGTGTDTMRLSDRPFGKVPLLPHEKENDYKNLKYPGVHSFRAGRTAAIEAYKNAGITDPLKQIDLVELHDAYTSSEIQTYEDLGLCKYGEGAKFVESGKADLKGELPVNPSGGLLACGHPVGATGIMQSVFMFWQLQHKIDKHFKDKALQVKDAKTGLIHSHAGTGTYVTVSIMEAV